MMSITDLARISNVGPKSRQESLINSLCQTRVAFSSKKAGKTRYLNYFLLDKKYYLVDAPGYGFTRYGSEEDEAFGNMMETYFDNPTLKGAIWLLDARREMNEDDQMLLQIPEEEPGADGFGFHQERFGEAIGARQRSQESLNPRESARFIFSYDGKKIDPLRSLVAHLYEE
jgi:hypothetical protein